MTAPDRDSIQTWIEELGYDSYICPNCEGVHLSVWEEKKAVLEARCFVESDRCAMLVEIGIRSSAVLPLQGAIHFMNFDFSLIKVMLSMTDFDVPRLLLTHALPSEHLTEELFKDWLPKLLAEMDTIYAQLEDMDVLFVSEIEQAENMDEQLH
ncbi:YbjN domain-containing protein [Reinekea marinisedimentorum]|uniref:Sensory transduction regulator n=1 Tax=Reinekea marinisedimentorum TaxID=230495 RepID=A0A4R3IB13_9GAMM|nr:YbjN domain-containing protein [Reinekea marinisedimentorum]TCS41627.1 hypothetical protein BCF53_10554 [Reinekea marinisedimentorum]